MDSGSWLTAIGNLLLAGGVFERVTLMALQITRASYLCVAIDSYVYIYTYIHMYMQ